LLRLPLQLRVREAISQSLITKRWIFNPVGRTSIDATIVPPEKIRSAHDEAIAQKYLWHEFGDLNLIL
jgi:hypothetical protein